MKALLVLTAPDVDPEIIGPIPLWLDEEDPRPAREQLDEHYQHGGGWQPFPGFELGKDHKLTYPGDPPMAPLALLKFRNELILWYPYSWIMILQKDRSFEVCRMD
jgi:hypothetical protein